MGKLMSRMCLIVMAAGLCLVVTVYAEPNRPATGGVPAIAAPAVDKKPLIQMAILLDTSSSMEGLIDQARTELWAIVNGFIFARRNGIEPQLQVALYEYGKSTLSPRDGYIRQIVPLTTDLDKVSEELFALKTNGGDEYCGWVIKEATEKLNWSNSPDDLKVIFIAGNEPFTQGPIDYRQTCATAISKGIIVNTIHCGSDSDGLGGKWKDGAVLADGQYMCIDHNRQVVHIPAPQDKEIAELGIKLNDTYIAYGLTGNIASERQAAQDRNAVAVSKEAAVQRAVAKSSQNYLNSHWDLVDALQSDKVKLEDIKNEELPQEMQKMSQEERKAYIRSKEKQRAELQQKIQQLNRQRQKYVEEEMKKRGQETTTFGSAAIKAVREQAKNKNFTFEPPKVSPGRDATGITGR